MEFFTHTHTHTAIMMLLLRKLISKMQLNQLYSQTINVQLVRNDKFNCHNFVLEKLIPQFAIVRVSVSLPPKIQALFARMKMCKFSRINRALYTLLLRFMRPMYIVQN